MRVLHLEPARCASLHGSRGFHRDLPVRTDRKEVGLESGSGETFMVTKSSLLSPAHCVVLYKRFLGQHNRLLLT